MNIRFLVMFVYCIVHLKTQILAVLICSYSTYDSYDYNFRSVVVWFYYCYSAVWLVLLLLFLLLLWFRLLLLFFWWIVVRYFYYSLLVKLWLSELTSWLMIIKRLTEAWRFWTITFVTRKCEREIVPKMAGCQTNWPALLRQWQHYYL